MLCPYHDPLSHCERWRELESDPKARRSADRGKNPEPLAHANPEATTTQFANDLRGELPSQLLWVCEASAFHEPDDLDF